MLHGAETADGPEASGRNDATTTADDPPTRRSRANDLRVAGREFRRATGLSTTVGQTHTDKILSENPKDIAKR